MKRRRSQSKMGDGEAAGYAVGYRGYYQYIESSKSIAGDAGGGK